MTWGRRAIAIGAALCALAWTALVSAQPAANPPAPGPAAAASDDDKTAAARKHFQNGIKLFQDGHYAGALAEFEAAYGLKPGPSSLKNIALSQKALYRYAEAADSLRNVLSRHASELSDDERRAVEQAIEELASLVGSIVIRVTPDSAKVTLDGRAIDATQRKDSINLNVGEHTIVAEAPGYARASRTIRVAGGQRNVPVDISLQATAGFLVVRAQHPDDAIAVDNVGKAFHRWSGPLTPGEHYVQVYRSDQRYKAFDQRVLISVGKTVEIDVPPLELLPPDEVPDPQTGQPKSRQLRGWYGLVALSFLGMRDAPDGLEVDESNVAGASFGVRAGYRLWTPIAVEMLLEGSRFEVKDACDKNVDNQNGGCVKREFTLDAVRLGPNLRIMSGGETIRFTSTLGAGAVRHVLEVKPLADNVQLASGDTPDEAARATKAKGWDPYFLLEVGAQFNWGHILMEANVTAFIDGASNAKDGGYHPFEETGGLVAVGLGLRGGWSEWTPRDAPR